MGLMLCAFLCSDFLVSKKDPERFLHFNQHFNLADGSLDPQDNIPDDEISDYNTKTSLRIAWDPWFPYQYLKTKNLQSSLTGLDIELEKMFSKQAKYKLKYIPIPWVDTVSAISEGKIDVAAGATYSKERAEVAHFSIPYRTEDDSLYVLEKVYQKYTFKTVDEFIHYMKQGDFRLGVLKNNLYADPKLNEFISDPNNAKNVVILQNYTELIEGLTNRKVNGFLADRIIASTLIWQARLSDIITEHYLKMQTPIHLMFSKKTVSEETVETFNQAIKKLYHKQQYNRIFAWYLYPVIIVQTTGEDWFRMLDILGAFFFSISGVIIAYTLNHTLLAAFLYAFLPSMCGFIIRDVIFNQRPIEVLSSPEYMLVVCSTVLISYFLIILYSRFQHLKIFKHPPKLFRKLFPVIHFHVKNILIICDALGLAALTVSGVAISLMARADPLWLWGPFFAFVSAAFGSIVRDILSKKEAMELVVGEIYSEIAIVWGLFFSVALVFNVNNITPELVRNLILITVGGAFFSRLLVYYFEVPNVHFR